MKLGRWSTTAGSNNATPPDGFPEGQAASTLNDAAREVMASIRTVFNDAQFFDQDFTPTFSTVTSFTVAGDQTSAIHAGRRLKLFDGSTMYATVTTASFTAVTTIHVTTDSGSNLTTSLSSFAIATLSNKGLPQAQPIAKAWAKWKLSLPAADVILMASYGVSSVSRSATGTYRVNFTIPMADTNYTYAPGFETLRYCGNISATVSSFKFTLFDISSAPIDVATSSFGHSMHFYR